MAHETILVIDDDDSLRKIIEFTLRQAGHKVVACANGEEGLKAFDRFKPGLVITDVRLGDISGYTILKKVKAARPATLVIVITAFGSIENAVEAMKLGAYDYLAKPFTLDQLKELVSKATRFQTIQASMPEQSSAAKVTPRKAIVGQSQAMHSVMNLIEKVAASEASVLILGESGTGKELVARSIHQKSVRAQGPFIAVNCAAIPRDLVESELFGHIKGSFTGAVKDRAGKFELARGGTIFLDEIGDLPLELQPKLLRALQERVVEPVGGESHSVDVRVVAATNLDIETAVAKGTFREDLYYRIAVIPVSLPPLRARREDIPALIDHFLEKFGRGSEVTFTATAMQSLRDYRWPGNVRELENAIEQLLVLAPSNTIEESQLPPRIRQNRGLAAREILQLPEEGYSLEELEKEAVLQALERNDWNKTRAAEFLKIPRHILLYRMEKFGITK
ncbi:sigma-54 dependent transcriptional regulator [Desulfuromonas carbonis]|uniref:sigma-54-dependent transcriptional regulator n=1 Tax=Desulfuromonas sp. DDH964 TaxID=1823759 RepID=UPI001E5056A7|nr:sigma-54 dependent transcriptional regulator [Desulfuromonas sp. DDH964]